MLLLLLLLLLTSQKCLGFTGLVGRARVANDRYCGPTHRDRELRMVFDFLRKRSEEGIAQVQNIASKTIEGKLGEALQETSEYISSRQKADLENLKRLKNHQRYPSRQRPKHHYIIWVRPVSCVQEVK